MPDFLSRIPPWVAGNAPVWALFIMAFSYIVIQWLKNQPIIEQQKITAKQNAKDGYMVRIEALEKAVRDCQRESDDRERELNEAIDALKEKINNEAWQRVQSEISLVRTIIAIIPDNDQLKVILEALQRRSASLPMFIDDGNGPVK